MTYGQVKREALRLIFSDTLAGEPIQPSYNNQADYILAIPSLVDAAQTLIATTARKIPALMPLACMERTEDGAFDVYRLPKNCWRLAGGGLIAQGRDETGGAALGRYKGYRLFGGSRLYVPKGKRGLTAGYWRYPESVGEAPADELELDNGPEVHAAIPYYVAAHLALYDDAFRYSALYNEFEARLNRLSEPLFVEEETTADAYLGFAAEGEG